MAKLNHSFKGRGKPKIKIPSIPEDTNKTLTLGEAATFLASRLIRTGQETGQEKQVRNKVRERILYAINNGKLPGNKQAIPYGKLIAWAREKNARKKNGLDSAFEDLAANIEEMVEDKSVGSDELFDVTLPDNLPRCHSLISALTMQNRRLQIEKKTLEAKLARAEAELAKIARRREVGRESALKANISRKTR